MAATIEAFVEKLQAEGVQAGRAKAARIAEEAQGQGEKIIAAAKTEAEGIVQQACKQAEETLQRSRDELQLAARDALLSLRETIVQVLEAVFRQAAGEAFNDDEFLKQLVHDVCVQYAEKDALGDGPVQIRVSEEKLKAVTEWAISEMKHRGHDDWESQIDLKGRLQSAGFEYKIAGGTVEVTPESVAAVLGAVISPRLREMIDQAIAARDA